MTTDSQQGPSTRDLLSLPKAELHLHLEGAMVGFCLRYVKLICQLYGCNLIPLVSTQKLLFLAPVNTC